MNGRFRPIEVDEEDQQVVTRENFHYLKCFEGHKSLVSSVLYFDQEKRIVTSSFDDRIRIWDYKTGKCIRILKDCKDSVNHLIKWNVRKGTFLACSDGGDVMEFSVIKKRLIRKIRPFERKRYGYYNYGRRQKSYSRLLKLDSKHFVVAEEDSKVLIVMNYKTGGEICAKKNHNGDLDSSLCLILSKKFKKSFYYNRSISSGYSIRLLSFVRKKKSVYGLKQRKQFFSSKFGDTPGTIGTYEGLDGREILVVGCNGGFLYFFDTSLPTKSMFFRKMDCKLGRELDFKCCVTFNIKKTRFGLFGADDGIMILYNFNIFKTIGDNVANSMHRNKDIVMIKLISISHHIVMITASGDWTSKVFSINIKKKKVDLDLVERVTEYVKTEFLEIWNEEERDNEFFSIFRIRLPFNETFLVYKTFLL